MTTLPNKRISSYSVNVKSSYTLWVGALARIDFLSGTDKYFTFFIPPHVTIHRTPILKADSVYEKHAGVLLRPAYNANPTSVEWTPHPLSLTLNDHRIASFDLVIDGLGWVSL